MKTTKKAAKTKGAHPLANGKPENGGDITNITLSPKDARAPLAATCSARLGVAKGLLQATVLAL